MKVGSLVRNKSSQYLGVVTEVHSNDVRIHWLYSQSVIARLWSKYSHNLEVICE